MQFPDLIQKEFPVERAAAAALIFAERLLRFSPNSVEGDEVHDHDRISSFWVFLPK